MNPRGNGTHVAFFVLAVLASAVLIANPVAGITLTPGASSGSTPVISQGDPVYINGIATGQPSQGLQIWLIGTNYVKIATVTVNNDNTYSYELKKADTSQLASGQYVVLVQHPMMNGQFDVTYDSSTGAVMNRISGQKIFQLTGSNSLQSPQSAYALLQAIGSENIDDTFASTTFLVSNPTVSIHNIGERTVGDKFTIAGTTNLAVGDDLMVDIRSTSFSPTKKTQSGEYYGSSGQVKVVSGSGSSNSWSYDVDTSGWKPDSYFVTVTGITVDTTDTGTFDLLAATPATTVATTVPATEVTTAVPADTTPPVTPAATTAAESPAATKAPLSFALIPAALGILAIIPKIRKRE